MLEMGDPHTCAVKLTRIVFGRIYVGGTEFVRLASPSPDGVHCHSELPRYILLGGAWLAECVENCTPQLRRVRLRHRRSMAWTNVYFATNAEPCISSNAKWPKEFALKGRRGVGDGIG
ncbi:hypothetical protein GCM10023094_09260 [Rhodococcus olei]|uniref:Uncharacterized protein n=1 Tax=Rhodococcus olei TaxID=2161675 RepID=A0ABP8NVW0_9NOCA